MDKNDESCSCVGGIKCFDSDHVTLPHDYWLFSSSITTQCFILYTNDIFSQLPSQTPPPFFLSQSSVCSAALPKTNLKRQSSTFHKSTRITLVCPSSVRLFLSSEQNCSSLSLAMNKRTILLSSLWFFSCSLSFYFINSETMDELMEDLNLAFCLYGIIFFLSSSF